MIAALVLLLARSALGELDQLAPFADRLQLRVEGNLLNDRDAAALSRWPSLVEVELKPPLSRIEAAQLRKLGRLAARVPKRDPSLKLLGPALVRTEIALPPAAGGEPVCEGSLRGEVLALPNIDACALRWLTAHLTPHPEQPELPARR